MRDYAAWLMEEPTRLAATLLSAAGVALSLVALGLLYAGCNVAVRARVGEPGVYECTRQNSPTRRFNSEAETTVLWRGTDGVAVEFIDLDTGERVKLFQNESTPYKCARLNTVSRPFLSFTTAPPTL